MAKRQSAHNFPQENDLSNEGLGSSARLFRRYINPYLLIVLGISHSGFITLYYSLGYKHALGLAVFWIVFGAIVIIDDVTQRRRGKRDLHRELERKSHASKMTTLGEVAGNLAHEINTPLSTVLISLDGMNRAIKEDDKKSLESYMHCILQANKRMSAIVSAFRRYCRKDGVDEKPETVDIREILSDALEICEPDIKSRGLTLEHSMPSRPLLTQCCPGPLSQAIINLMTNARDAAVAVPKGWVRLSASESEGWVLIDVEDAGLGLREGTDARIFEPYFSTKARGFGSGVGLGIVRDIARAHGGEVTHIKKNGHTCFEIKIPIRVA